MRMQFILDSWKRKKTETSEERGLFEERRKQKRLTGKYRADTHTHIETLVKDTIWMNIKAYLLPTLDHIWNHITVSPLFTRITKHERVEVISLIKKHYLYPDRDTDKRTNSSWVESLIDDERYKLSENLSAVVKCWRRLEILAEGEKTRVERERA